MSESLSPLSYDQEERYDVEQGTGSAEQDPPHNTVEPCSNRAAGMEQPSGRDADQATAEMPSPPWYHPYPEERRTQT